MGVACLFNWPIPAGKSPTQGAELLHKRIKALGAVESGTFAVDCDTYQSQVMWLVQWKLKHNYFFNVLTVDLPGKYGF